MRTNLKSKIREYLNGSYFIGIVENFGIDTITNNQVPNIHWINLNGYKGGWFADPFILEVSDDEIVLLAEEYFHNNNKGRLSKLTISRNGYLLKSVEPFLEHTTHLSFPYYIKENNNLYICPESGQRNEVALYKLNHSECSFATKIIEGKMLDTQIVIIDNSYYAFTVEAAGKGMDDTKKLQIFKSASLHGPYHKIQEINNAKCRERGAGPIFEIGGKLIRPAQICDGGYGKGVIFYEIKKDKDVFEEIEIGKITANSKMKNGLCFHTFSPSGNIAAVDGFDYKFRFLGSLAPFIYKLKSSINKFLH